MTQDKALAALRRSVRQFERRHSSRDRVRASGIEWERLLRGLVSILEDVDTVSDVEPRSFEGHEIAKARAAVSKARDQLARELGRGPKRG